MTLFPTLLRAPVRDRSLLVTLNYLPHNTPLGGVTFNSAAITCGAFQLKGSWDTWTRNREVNVNRFLLSLSPEHQTEDIHPLWQDSEGQAKLLLDLQELDGVLPESPFGAHDDTFCKNRQNSTIQSRNINKQTAAVSRSRALIERKMRF